MAEFLTDSEFNLQNWEDSLYWFTGGFLPSTPDLTQAVI